MTTTYLLPCSCGEKISVEPRHAGQQLQCVCGRTLTAPSMLQITRLERAPVPGGAASAAAPAWGIAQQLMTVGAVIVALGVVLGAIVLVTAPQPPTRGLTTEFIDRNMMNSSPRECLHHWTMFFETGLDPGKKAVEKAYETARTRYLMVLALAGGLTAAGIATLALGRWQARRARQEDARSA